jgi:stage V sporulation protein S
VVREHHRAEVQAIGAGAVNQALKALVLATGYLKNDGIYVTCVPEFADVTIEDKVRTAIKLVIEPTPDSNFSSLRVSSSVRSDVARAE